MIASVDAVLGCFDLFSGIVLITKTHLEVKKCGDPKMFTI